MLKSRNGDGAVTTEDCKAAARDRDDVAAKEDDKEILECGEGGGWACAEEVVNGEIAAAAPNSIARGSAANCCWG